MKRIAKISPQHHVFKNLVRLFTLSLIWALSGCASNASIEPHISTIDIDKGTVYLKIADDNSIDSHKITYRPQGTCVPEVSIVSKGKYSDLSHTEDCHGTGRNQGTIFDIELAPNQKHIITLTMGRILAPSISQSETIKHISADVTVGAIQGGGKNTQVERTLLLGAKATAHNPNLERGAELFITVELGTIDFKKQQVRDR